MRAATVLAPLFAIVALFAGTAAHAARTAAQTALDESKDGRAEYNVVQNRFFLKEKRFELSPLVGAVPNDPMVKRFIGGVLVGYHLSETFAAEGAFLLAPDRGVNDLKDLTRTLVQIAEEGSGDVAFQQPVEKMVLGATFAARWAPVYGKINLIGERVLNFDLYGIAGLGLLSIKEYYAKYNTPDDPVALLAVENKAKPAVNLGVGMDFFVSGSIAIKIDVRSYLYGDKKPQYDPNKPVDETRLYNTFLTSAGVSVFFPKMKPRIYNF